MNMKIIAQINQFYKLCLALSGQIEAYHGGSELVRGSFSLAHLGSGEGNLYLGPGIYFTTNRNGAIRYGKYSNKPFLYKVSIKSDGLYDPNRGEPLHLREKAIKLQDDLRKQFNLPTDKYLNSTDSFRYGKDFIGFMVQKLGRGQTHYILESVGINGIYENLPGGSLEIAVFNPSIITILEKEELVDIKEKLKREQEALNKV